MNGPRREFTDVEILTAVGIVEALKSENSENNGSIPHGTIGRVAKQQGMSRRALSRFLVRKVDTGSPLPSRKRSGRPRILTPEEENTLGDLVISPRKDGLAWTGKRIREDEPEIANKVSRPTIARIMRRQGRIFGVPKYKNLAVISEANMHLARSYLDHRSGFLNNGLPSTPVMCLD